MTTLINARSARKKTTRVMSLGQIFALYRERHALARLDDAALNDIGLTRDEANAEANRPFWDIFAR